MTPLQDGNNVFTVVEPLGEIHFQTNHPNQFPEMPENEHLTMRIAKHSE
jgi:hypothetical protein